MGVGDMVHDSVVVGVVTLDPTTLDSDAVLDSLWETSRSVRLHSAGRQRGASLRRGGMVVLVAVVLDSDVVLEGLVSDVVDVLFGSTLLCPPGSARERPAEEIRVGVTARNSALG